jgi:hypothetical protein
VNAHTPARQSELVLQYSRHTSSALHVNSAAQLVLSKHPLPPVAVPLVMHCVCVPFQSHLVPVAHPVLRTGSQGAGSQR